MKVMSRASYLLWLTPSALMPILPRVRPKPSSWLLLAVVMSVVTPAVPLMVPGLPAGV